MATAYSSEMSVGTYNRLRLKVDYSGTSATCTIQFRRTSAYSTTWSDSGSKLTFNGTTKNASYSYTGNVGTSWINLVTVSGYSVSTSGSSYSFSFTKQYGVLECSGSIWVPGQNVAPTKPTCSATPLTKNTESISWGTTNLGTPTGTVSLYYKRYSLSDYTLEKTVSTTGTNTDTLASLWSNTYYNVYAEATNSVGTATSDTVTFLTLPPDISSVTTLSITSTSITIRITTGYYSTDAGDLTTQMKASDASTYTGIKKNYSWFDYTISNLTPSTTYTYNFRNFNTTGYSNVYNYTFTTLSDVMLYGSVNGQTKKVKKLYGSVNGQTKKIKKLYGSVNGQTKLIYQG